MAAKKLILMQGLPGGGKSTKARKIKEIANHAGDSCCIISTDDYFMADGAYLFDGSEIGQAHGWNQARCRKLMAFNPPDVIIVDNTNLQFWEMRPYVLLAQEYGYTVFFEKPDTEWAFSPTECAKRTLHGVPEQAIVRMAQRYQCDPTVEKVLAAKKG